MDLGLYRSPIVAGEFELIDRYNRLSNVKLELKNIFSGIINLTLTTDI